MPGEGLKTALLIGLKVAFECGWKAARGESHKEEGEPPEDYVDCELAWRKEEKRVRQAMDNVDMRKKLEEMYN